MKIVVIGGSGLIGSQLVKNLRKLGLEVEAASPSLGVNTITGEGLNEVLDGAKVVVDVSNSPSYEDKAVMEFFDTSTRNLLIAEMAAGVEHHVALSIVGADGLLQNGYLRAKTAQEELIKSFNIPYTIVRATQFFEFVSAIAYAASEDEIVRLPKAFIQPIAAKDLAATLVDFTIRKPLNGTVNVAGPEKMTFEEFIGSFMRANEDNRKIVKDDKAQYFGAELNEDSLVPTGKNTHITSTRFEDWLSSNKV